MPEIARINGVPERWMATNARDRAKRQNRAKRSSSSRRQIQALPAQAAMIKARAVAAEKAPPMPQGDRDGAA
jgi:hypothetical protein